MTQPGQPREQKKLFAYMKKSHAYKPNKMPLQTFFKIFPIQFAFHVGKLRLQDHIIAGKVYFVAWHYDVKLQADNHVRWDVAERLNRKQRNIGGKMKKWHIST